MRTQKVLCDAVVCYLFDKKGKILLAMKPESDEGERGCWNGYGGGIEKGEAVEITATREVYEETGKGVIAPPYNLKKVAIIDFYNHQQNGNVFTCRVHFFISSRWFGEPKDSKEMKKPTFFHKNNIPYNELMPADRHFLPILLRGDKIIAEYCYSPFQQNLIGFPQINFVNSF